MAGFSDMQETIYIDPSFVKARFSMRIKDMFKQTWHDDTMSNSQCDFYRTIKESHNIEKYLIELTPRHRYSLTKFRTRTNHMPITKIRFSTDISVNVACPLCACNEAGDEQHYLIKCSFFEAERRKLLPKILLEQNPQINELFFDNLDKDDLVKLSCFVRTVMCTFKYTKESDSITEAKNSKITRYGRTIKPSVKLSLQS